MNKKDFQCQVTHCRGYPRQLVFMSSKKITTSGIDISMFCNDHKMSGKYLKTLQERELDIVIKEDDEVDVYVIMKS